MYIYIFVIEPWTITSFPLHATHHTELSCTATRHVIASFFQFHHCRAAVAFLPAFLLRGFDELFRHRILGTVATCMCFIIADGTHPGAATFAFAYLSAMFKHDVIGLDPLTAAFADTVDLVLRLVFEEFAIPGLLEFLVEEFVDVFEIDMFVCAAARRHMSWVCDGHLENASKTRVTHSMFAW